MLNTDAEGRLILGDALTLAQRLGATHLVDIATLTGACVVALGHHASGLLGAPAAWVESVRQVADRAGERVWPLPMFEEYAEQLQSETADLANTGGRPGGAITAGMFLKTFSGGLPWAHLDIAGTAWYDSAQPFHTKGATGVGGAHARGVGVRSRVVDGPRSQEAGESRPVRRSLLTAIASAKAGGLRQLLFQK